MPDRLFKRQDDVGAVNKLIEDKIPRTEAQGIVITVDPASAWVQINGSNKVIPVDIIKGIKVLPNDHVALRRLPGASGWTIYGVSNLGGQAGDSSSTSSPGGTTGSPVAAPSNLVVVPMYGALAISWTPPNASSDQYYEVEVADSSTGTGAVIYKVAGSSLMFFGSVIKYVRVRGLGDSWIRSGWTGYISATPISFNETIDDRVAALILAGANITITYDDTANTLTINAAAPSIRIEEDDLSPSISPVSKIIVPAGSLTDDGGGIARLAFPAGTAGALSVIKKTIETRTVIYDVTLVAPGGFDITSIPSGYDRLEFSGDLRAAGTIGGGIAEVFMFFNNDTTPANYTDLQLYGHVAGSAGSGAPASADIGLMLDSSSLAAFPNPISGEIKGYAGTGDYKLAEAWSYAANNYIIRRSSRWINTAAINRITLGTNASGNNFATDSRFQLIGIKTEQLITSITGDLTETVKAYGSDFTYATASPLLIRSALSGERVVRVLLDITTAFDGTPALTVGDTGNSSRFMTSSDNRPGFIAIYDVDDDYLYGADTDIKLYITVGGATVGAGRVFVETE